MVGGEAQRDHQVMGVRTPFAAGTDLVHLDDDGRIASVAVFVDRAPAGFDPEAHH